MVGRDVSGAGGGRWIVVVCATPHAVGGGGWSSTGHGGGVSGGVAGIGSGGHGYRTSSVQLDLSMYLVKPNLYSWFTCFV